MSNIIIGRIEISKDIKKVMEYHREDDVLITAMEQFKNNLDDETEIFYEKENIIATEEGYYITIQEDELKAADE